MKGTRESDEYYIQRSNTMTQSTYEYTRQLKPNN